MFKSTQIHRFGDTVAMYLSKGETVYLTPSDARKIAKALNACARDIGSHKFVDGNFSTFALDLADTGHNGTAFKVSRKETTK